MISSIIQPLFKINIQSKEKKWQRIYDPFNAETKPNFLCLPYTKQRIFFFYWKELFKRRGCGGLNKKKTKEGFLTAIATVIKKDPTTRIRKNATELKVYDKTVRTAIKWDLRPNPNPIVYAMCGVTESQTGATSHLNIGLLKIAIEMKLNKICEEFIYKACKSRRRVNNQSE